MSTSAEYRPWDYDILVKILIVGDSGVGKSCLLVRYSDDEFLESHLTTIGVDFKIKTETLKDNRTAKIQLWDTAGQERFSSIVSAYYRSSNGIMVVFDLTNEESFKNIAKWLSQIKQHGLDNVSLVLVGNKSDLKSKRVIDKDRAEELAKNLGIPYIETSAKSSDNVDNAFKTMLQRVVDSHNYMESEFNKKKDTTTVTGPKGTASIGGNSNNTGCCK
ncbi:hypothetical protein ABK040_006296 [Willaertia magna]